MINNCMYIYMILNQYIHICKPNHQPSPMTYHNMAKQLPSHLWSLPCSFRPHVVRSIHHKSLRQPRPSEKKHVTYHYCH